MSDVLGVIVLARNGARSELYQDPGSYAPGSTDSTPLGVSSLHTLGSQLRATYLTPGSSSFIDGISSDLADTQQINVRAKAGGEGPVVFDSAIALLQGLFPPTTKNKITLADGKEVMAPAGWISWRRSSPGMTARWRAGRIVQCNFKKHIAAFHASDQFKKKAKEAGPFLNDVKDYVFGRTTTLENIWNIHDFISTQLTYNQTYAYRLPPTFIEQARALADWHEDGVFSDENAGGIGNVAGRTVMNTVLNSLERIAFNGDPLQMMVLQTTYQPFISLFHQTALTDGSGKALHGIPNFGSALAIELRRGAPPDSRDFLRLKFLNASDGAGQWELVHPFGHKADVPLTEFIYRAEGAAIKNNKEWAQVCGTSASTHGSGWTAPVDAVNVQTLALPLAFGLLMLVLVAGAFGVRQRIANKKQQRRIRLLGEEGQFQPEPAQVVVEKIRFI
ncbi:histidine phosphatase superfamily [Mycena amicta]|nr:histidine phosphatase superfamily [Mycena amicta]